MVMHISPECNVCTHSTCTHRLNFNGKILFTKKLVGVHKNLVMILCPIMHTEVCMPVFNDKYHDYMDT